MRAVALAVWWSVLIGGVLSPTHAQVTLRAPEAGAVEVAGQVFEAGQMMVFRPGLFNTSAILLAI